MNVVYLSFCGLIVKVILHKSQYPAAKKAFLDSFIKTHKTFICPAPHRLADYTINIFDVEWKNIMPIKKGSNNFIYLYSNKSENEIITSYFISPGLSKIILTRILESQTAKLQGVLIHASSSIINGKTDIFCGISGTGKSTIASLLRNSYKVFADDTVFVVKRADRFIAYQTPFLEKFDWIERGKKSYPVGRIFFLIQSKKCKIAKIQSKDIAFQEFMKRFGTQKDLLKKQTKILLKLISTHDCYYLYFSKNKKELVNLLGKNT